ncbi:MAG TPA: protein-export chaperone SecB [Pyrinomonadaceae bacterium]|nr:protein-export chaperone SecB [Pyrinomonadaceae bacterium]
MSEEETLKLYPIQAVHIGPRELYIKANEPPSESLGMEGSDCDFVVGHSDYDPSEKVIKIAIKAEAGRSQRSSEGGPESKEVETKDLPPFHLRIEMVGIFAVDDTMFPADRIYEWANNNALFIMYPYLREHVFALTVRAGFKPLLLPLVEVPLFRITPNSSTVESPTAQPQLS